MKAINIYIHRALNFRNSSRT